MPRPPRTIGLDKPCRVCGKPIHYTYSGPVEGVCGRCADRRRPRGRRPYHRAMVLHRGGPERPPSKAAAAVKLSLVVVLGAAAVMVALKYLLA